MDVEFDKPLLVEYDYVTERQFEALKATRQNAKDGNRQDLDEYISLAVDLCEYNVPLFTHIFLGAEPGPHIPRMYRRIQEERKVTIRMPRGHSKSTLCELGIPVHGASYSAVGRQEYTSAIFKQSKGVATKVSTSIQKTMEKGGPGGLLHEAFGDFKAEAARWKDRTMWVGTDANVDKDPTIEVLGIRESPTGGHHDDLILDDVCDSENSHTEYKRNKMWKEDWGQTIEGMIDPMTRVLCPHTLKFEDDLNQRLKDDERFYHIELPLLVDNEGKAIFPKEDHYRKVYNERGTLVWVELTEKGRRELNAQWPCPRGRCEGPLCAGGNEYNKERIRQGKDHLVGIPLHRSVEWAIFERWLTSNRSASITENWHQLNTAEDYEVQLEMIRFWAEDDHPLIGEEHPQFPNGHEVQPLPSTDNLVDSCHVWDHAGQGSDLSMCCQAYRSADDALFLKWRGNDEWGFVDVVGTEQKPGRMQTFWEADRYRVGECPVVSESLGMQDDRNDAVLASSSNMIPLIRTADLKYVKDGPITQTMSKWERFENSGYLRYIANGKVYFHVDNEDAISQHLHFTGDDKHDDYVDTGTWAKVYFQGNVGTKADTYSNPGIHKRAGRRFR